MSGLEVIVLAPLAYGILHLGKKVIEQREIIDSQMEAIAQQQLAIEAARAAASSSGPRGGDDSNAISSDTLLGKAMMVGSLSVAGALTCYNLYKLRRGGGGDGGEENDESSSVDPAQRRREQLRRALVQQQRQRRREHGSSLDTTPSHSATTTANGSSSQPTANHLSSSHSAAASRSQQGDNGVSSSTNTAVSGTAAAAPTAAPVRSSVFCEPPVNYEPQPATTEHEECKVCLHHQRDTLVMPCNHFAMCWECAEEVCLRGAAANAADQSGVSRGVGSCPVCREPIRALQFVYV